MWPLQAPHHTWALVLPMVDLDGLLSERQPEPQERLCRGLPRSAVWAEWSSLALGLPSLSSRGNKSRLGACCHSSPESSLQVEYGTI